MTSEFRAETDYNPFLAAGHDTLHAVVTITAPDDLARTTGRAEVVVVDRSSSMNRGRKMAVARDAACAAVGCLDDGVAFAVVAGNAGAEQIWPREPGALATSSPSEREAACGAIAGLRADGMTAMGRWLTLARRLLDDADAGLRHVLLLSDGWNTDETDDELHAATEACRGAFSCDCLGVGVDWRPVDLRFIADTLHGREGMVGDVAGAAGRDELVGLFRSLVGASQAKAAADLRLRVVTRDMSDVGTVRQEALKIVELTDRAEVAVDGHRATELRLGAWGPGDVHSYFVELRIRPDQVEPVGGYKRIAMVQLVRGDGRVVTSSTIEARWTDDEAQITRDAPSVSRHRNRYELAALIQAGVAAWDRGDEAGARRLLDRAARLARAAGDEAQVRRLAKLVRTDPATGAVELLGGKADRMEADTYSSAISADRWSGTGDG